MVKEWIKGWLMEENGKRVVNDESMLNSKR